MNQPGGEVHHGDIVGGNPEAHAGHAALELRNHLAHGLGRAGGRGNDVAQHAAAGPPVPARPGIHRLLLGGGSVDGGHQGLTDSEGVVDDFGHGSQAVGGAGGIGNHIHVRRVGLVVDAHDECGGAFVFGRGGEHHLLGAVEQVDGGLLRGIVGTGGLYDVLGFAVVPGDQGRVALTVYPDLLAVDDQVPVIMFHHAPEGPEHGVVLDLIDHVVQIRVAQVDAADLVAAAAPLHHAAQSHSSDSAEAVDSHLNCHASVPFHFQNKFCRPRLADFSSLYSRFSEK